MSAAAFRKGAFAVLRGLGTDGAFRRLNRDRLLILAYHGVTRREFPVPPWTLISLSSFEEQMDYLSRRYRVISLGEAVEAMTRGGKLPPNAAVITFDDGYRNNLTLALPVLRRYGMPATVFLTAGYVGSESILPLDEAYLAVTRAKHTGPVSLPGIGLGPLRLGSREEVARSCRETVAVLKRYPAREQRRHLAILKETLGSEYLGSPEAGEFGIVSPPEVASLLESGLIRIGAHTVSHEILANLGPGEAATEIIESKRILERLTGREVDLFAYPNGTEADFNEGHVRCLRECGFAGSVTTVSRLNRARENPYRLARISVGPGFEGNLGHFAMKVCGFTPALKSLGGRALA